MYLHKLSCCPPQDYDLTFRAAVIVLYLSLKANAQILEEYFSTCTMRTEPFDVA